MSDKTRIEMTDEETLTLLNVAIAEYVLGFVRNHGERGRFSWEGIDVRSGQRATLALEELPDFARDVGLASALLAKFATDHDFVPRLTIDNRAYRGAEQTPVHIEIYQREIKPNRPMKLRRIVGVSASNVPRAVCRAACEVYGVAVERLHRDLFPGRYIMAVK